MKELKQTHVNYLTLFNTLVILGVIVFFLRKWKEMCDREEERETKIDQLQKALKDGNTHNKAVLSRLDKRLREMHVPQRKEEKIEFHPPTINEEIRTEENDDISDALTSLMA